MRLAGLALMLPVSASAATVNLTAASTTIGSTTAKIATAQSNNCHGEAVGLVCRSRG